MRLIYTGIAYIHGVPARDLDGVEARQYAETITQQQLLSGLLIYRKADDDGDETPLQLDVVPDDDEPAEE
jgi:hypothetical protein